MVMMNAFLFNGIWIFMQRVFGGGGSGDAILQEDGFFLLQEGTTDRILQE